MTFASRHAPLSDDALAQLFLDARTHYGWSDRPVEDAQLHRLYALASLGPTAYNSSPARIVFVRSREAKEKLKPALSEGNREKSMAAPVVAIVATDLAFHARMDTLNPPVAAGKVFDGKDALISATATRNGTLQGAYLIVAARALGLDTGPMSGFDNAQVDALFLEGTTWKSNFLVALGYGDPDKLKPRNPRLPFDVACRIA